MKEKISRVSLIVCVIMLILSCFVPAVSGDMVVWFCITGIFAIPPIVAGTKLHRLLGIIALLIAIAAAAGDYRAGKFLQKRFDEIQKRGEENNSRP